MAKHRPKRKKTTKRTGLYESMPMAAQLPVAIDTAESTPVMPVPIDDYWQRVIVAGLTDIRGLLRRTFRSLRGRRAIISYAILVGIVTVGGGTVAYTMARSTFQQFSTDLASPSALLAKKKVGTTILDRNGTVLYQTYGATNSKLLTIDQVPGNLKNATLAAEDPTFYSHPAFSVKATARAVWVDLTHGSKLQGGSTITQQLVKSALLTPDKSFTRKYQELVLSVAVGARYSKDQILSMYLSDVYYGEGAYGVNQAAQTYFHEPLDQLTTSQAALLAGLPLSPSELDPVTNPDGAKARRNYVLDQMAKYGSITAKEAKTAEAEPIAVYPQSNTLKAPHFVFYVLDQLRQMYGQDTLEQGGLTVYTTLDLNKQNAAQDIVTSQVGKLAGDHVTNGGLVSIDPRSGDILAMVGSINYYQPDFGATNVTISNLQPGSSIKPIAYYTAFSKGETGATTVQDAPISLPNGDGSQWRPTDADQRWRGTVTLRRGLSNSLNIPAIHTLQFIGMNSFLQMSNTLGVTYANANQLGLSVVIGGGEVRPIDMAAAYGAFANNGYPIQPRSILKVLDRNGQDIAGPNGGVSSKQVLDPRYIYMLTNILSDNTARTEEFGPNSPLKLDRPAAAKTGTTDDYRDNWTIGYTPSVVTAVWVGNNDHTPMQGVTGISGAAPIWHDYMEAVLSGTPVENFTMPPGDTMVHLCNPPGSGGYERSYDEVFLSDAKPTHTGCEAPAPTPQPEPTPDQSHQGAPDTPTPTPVTTPTPFTTPPVCHGRFCSPVN